jgi:hypothetical protein
VPRKRYSLIAIGVVMQRVTKFLIVKGKDNEFFFTIKQNDSFLPMIIKPSDSFVGKLILLEDDVTVVLQKNLIVVDPLVGKIKLLITEAETALLITERGPKEDHYYLKATYRLLLECNTINNGKFTARINRIYVSN